MRVLTPNLVHGIATIGFTSLTPQPGDQCFDDWWDQANSKVADQAKKGLNSVIILVVWSIWKHRNRCVFDGLQPNLLGLTSIIKDEL